MQAVQKALAAVGPSNAIHKPYQGRSYLSQLNTSLLQKQVEIANNHLQADRLSS